MMVGELMNPGVVWVEADSTVAAAAKLLSRHNVGALPVCGPRGNLRGVVTDRDIVLRCVAAQSDPENTPVEAVMTRGVSWVAPGTPCREAARLMSQQQVRRLPVVEGDRVVGMLSLGDLAQCRRFDLEAARALSEISENVVVK